MNELVEAQKPGWIGLEEPADLVLLRLAKRDLDEGEAEAIALSLGGEATLLLVDEAEARGVTELYDLTKTGTIGLLIRAKRDGLIDLLRPELDKLIHQGGFWIAQPPYRRALEAVGE